MDAVAARGEPSGGPRPFSLAFSEALRAEIRGSGVGILALCPGAVATGFTAGLGDQTAASRLVYRRTVSPADVVRVCLRGFDHDTMTVIPGVRTRFLAPGHRFFPRTVMTRMAGRVLAPSSRALNRERRGTNHD